MKKLLMISGDRMLAQGKKGAFYNTLEELHKYWDRIDVICPRVEKPIVQEIFGNVYLHPSDCHRVMQSYFILKEGKELFKKHHFDLMTVHEYPPFYNGFGARLLHNKIKVPYILEIHHIPGYPKSSNLKESLYLLLTKMFLKFDSEKSLAIRIVNKKQLGEFMKNIGIQESKLDYIPSMYIDLDIFKPIYIEKKYDLIFVGRLVKNKGIDFFIETVKKLNCKAIIVGDGPLSKQIKNQIIFQKLDINLYGWAKDHNEISQLINQSKMLMMPSYNEGGPRVVFEAMACGVPAIVTPVGLVPDVIKDGVNGIVVDWNSETMATKIREVLNYESKLKSLGISALESTKVFEKREAIKNYAEQLKKYIND